ncbi:MAG: class A beta-lactamase [Muribaculaceae bacterium]|nr:class A beta-lactamase [Muribaculaceae bacterium]
MSCLVYFVVGAKGTRLNIESAEKELQNYIENIDARIGIACIYEGKDTLQINGNKEFPMLSVYKFPQSIAVINYCRENQKDLNDTVFIPKSDIKENTYSPIRDKFGIIDLKLPLKDILYYSLVESDNNACDVLYKLMGGTNYADSIITKMGFSDIHLINTEDEMHEDIYLSYQNRCTPLEMCKFVDYFNSQPIFSDKEYSYIKFLMENCRTGNDRLAKPFLSTNVTIGHKTGTGDVNSQGRIIGINDVGYIILPNKNKYSIAVFIADSKYTPETTSSFIADISEIIWHNIQ